MSTEPNQIALSLGILRMSRSSLLQTPVWPIDVSQNNHEENQDKPRIYYDYLHSNESNAHPITSANSASFQLGQIGCFKGHSYLMHIAKSLKYYLATAIFSCSAAVFSYSLANASW